MANISFYCTRCGRLTQFPASCRETVVYCPFCQQALIAPSIPSDEERETKASLPPSAPYESASSQAEARDYYSFNSTNPGVPIRSHLAREKTRRIVPIAGVSSSEWSLDALGDERLASSEREYSVFTTKSDVDDAEFMASLRDDAPEVAPVPPPPVFNSDLLGYSPASSRQESIMSTRFQQTVVIVAALSAVVMSVVIGVLAYRIGRSNAIDPKLAASEPISVEGRVVYRESSGVDAGDEGALLFFFPANRPFDKPLILSDLSPQDSDPNENEDFLNELAKKGGYFAVVGFDGYFSLEIAEPGDYRLLVVSKHIEDSVDDADKKTIDEISKYLFLPERKLLARNRFLWSTETIDERSGVVEKDFGKSSRNDL